MYAIGSRPAGNLKVLPLEREQSYVWSHPTGPFFQAPAGWKHTCSLPVMGVGSLGHRSQAPGDGAPNFALGGGPRGPPPFS